MNKTSIEWVKNPDGTQGYTWNPITGCLNHVNGLCKGGNFPCYAYRLAHGRLKERYLANKNIAPIGTMILGAAMGEKALRDPFYPRFWPERVKEDLGICRGIFVCDMSDLFGNGVPEEWTLQVLDSIKRSSHRNRYYLLTKQPQNLVKWSPFPDNCWVGVTACDEGMFTQALWQLSKIGASIKFISIEPFLKHIPMYVGGIKNCGINQIIIGALTGTKYDLLEISQRWNIQGINQGLKMMLYGNKWTLQPKIEWVREIVEAADKAGIPLFLKDNLKPLLSSNFNGQDVIESHNLWAFKYFQLRQEMPK